MRERERELALIVWSWVKYLFDGSILSRRRLSWTTLWDLNKVGLEWRCPRGREGIRSAEYSLLNHGSNDETRH